MKPEIMSLKEKGKMDWWVRSAKKNCATLNYIEHLFISSSAGSRLASISVFASLVGISIGFYRHFEFCTRIKNLCNKHRRQYV